MYGHNPLKDTKAQYLLLVDLRSGHEPLCSERNSPVVCMHDVSNVSAHQTPADSVSKENTFQHTRDFI